MREEAEKEEKVCLPISPSADVELHIKIVSLFKTFKDTFFTRLMMKCL